MVYGIDGTDKSRKQVLAKDDYTLAGLAMHTYNNNKVTVNSNDAVVLPFLNGGVDERLYKLVGKATNDRLTIKASGLYCINLRCEIVGTDSLVEIAPYKNAGSERQAYTANTLYIANSETRVLKVLMYLNAGNSVTFKALKKNNNGCTIRVLDCMIYALDWVGKVEK